MKRIVMLLVFVLIIPALSFAGQLDKSSIDDLQKQKDDLQRSINDLQKRKDEYTQLLNKLNKQNNSSSKEPVIREIKNQIDTISFEIEKKNSEMRDLNTRKRGMEDYSKQIEDKNIEKQLLRLGLYGGFSLWGNTNKGEFIWGGQFELPIHRFQRKVPPQDDHFPYNQISDVSLGFSYTMVGDEWLLSEGISNINTDANIHSIGFSVISRSHFDELFWWNFLIGINYNLLSIDKKDINTNVSKEFDNNVWGYHIGGGLGYSFKNNVINIIEGLRWEIFTEFRYTFLKLETTEIGKAWGVQIRNERNENHDFGVLKFGVNLIW